MYLCTSKSYVHVHRNICDFFFFFPASAGHLYSIWSQVYFYYSCGKMCIVLGLLFKHKPLEKQWMLCNALSGLDTLKMVFLSRTDFSDVILLCFASFAVTCCAQTWHIKRTRLHRQILWFLVCQKTRWSHATKRTKHSKFNELCLVANSLQNFEFNLSSVSFTYSFTRPNMSDHPLAKMACYFSVSRRYTQHDLDVVLRVV